MWTMESNMEEESFFDCANCKKIFESQNEVTSELKTFVSSDFSNNIEILDVLAYIYDIQWTGLFMHLCHEEEKKYQNEAANFKVLLCSQCAISLAILYKAYLDFESRTDSDSLLTKAKQFRKKVNEQPCKISRTDYVPENNYEKDKELFDSFNFDADNQSEFGDNESECKYSPEESHRSSPTCTKVTRTADRSTTKCSSTFLPPGKRLIVKLEKIPDEQLPKIIKRKSFRESKSKKKSLISHLATSEKKRRRKRCKLSSEDLSCPECNKQFTVAKNLWKHRQIHRKDRFVQCDICGKVLSSKKYMERHRKNHREDRAVNCEICGKLLASKEAIKMHNSRVHISETEKDMQRKPCEICGKMILGDNKSHMLTHTQEKEKFKCDKCSKTFFSKERLDLHLEAHDSTQIFKCSICNREFPIQKYLDEHHERHHNSEKPFGCDQCPVRFANKCHLEKHLIVHSADRPFVCEECGKTFKRKNHLKKHVQCHRDEELGPDAFKCTHCGKCLRNSVSFKIHTLQFHRSDLVTAKKVHECTICGRRLFDEKNLKKHYAAVHKEFAQLNCYNETS